MISYHIKFQIVIGNKYVLLYNQPTPKICNNPANYLQVRTWLVDLDLGGGAFGKMQRQDMGAPQHI